jgi:integrase
LASCGEIIRQEPCIEPWALEKDGRIGPGLTFHGLRHSVATELAELGYDDRTIADMLAQESEEMPAHYSRRARLEKKLMRVVEDMVRADTKRKKCLRESPAKDRRSRPLYIFNV